MPANIRPDRLSPKFRWNDAAGRYIAPNGQFIPFDQMRSALRKVMGNLTAEMEAAANALIAGDISIGAFQTEMMVLSKEVNLAGGALERGGFYVMTPEDFGKVGAKCRREYGYIDRMGRQIASGEQRLDGSLRSRARLYGKQGEVTYFDFAADTAERRQMKEERSILNPGESCDVCIDEAKKGWSELHSLIPIGERTCLSNCNCSMEYRNLDTGETRKT